MFDNNIHDQIDDRIDTVTRGLPGPDGRLRPLPRPQVRRHPDGRLLFALRGLRQQRGPARAAADRPARTRTASRRDFEKQAEAKRRELRQFLDGQYKLLSEAARQRTPDYLVRAATTPPDPLETAIFFLSLAPEDLRPQIVARWRRYLKDRSQPDDPVFGPWHDLMALPEADFAAEASAVVARWQTRPAGHQAGPVEPDGRRSPGPRRRSSPGPTSPAPTAS